MKRVSQNGVSSSSGSGSGSSASLDRYFLESSDHPNVEDFDILMWWKMNSSRYLSYRGHVLDSFRSSLSPNTVEAIICTQNQLKDAKKKRLVKLWECMDNVEDMDGFEIDNGKNIYMFILFIVCINYSIVYLFVQRLKIILF